MIDVADITIRLERIARRLEESKKAEFKETIVSQISIVLASLELVIREIKPGPMPGTFVAPIGVFWTGEEGAEVQRTDEDGIFESDLGAALAVAQFCDMPFLVYLDHYGDQPWSLHPFRTKDKAEAWANEMRSAGDDVFVDEGAPINEPILALVCDTRIEEFVDADIGNGFKGVRRRAEAEARTDPHDGNTYVHARNLHCDSETGSRTMVVITDIFGGHERIVSASEWRSWERINRSASTHD